VTHLAAFEICQKPPLRNGTHLSGASLSEYQPAIKILLTDTHAALMALFKPQWAIKE
jgi:hypothetical protein